MAGGSATSNSLYAFIAHSLCHGLNLLDPESLPSILRPHNERNDRPPNDGAGVSNLDEDDGVIVHVQFSELVRVKSLLIAAPPTGDGRPGRCKVWVNRPDGVDLGDVDSMAPEQEFELLEGETGAVEYPVRISKFSSTSSLTFYFFSLFYVGAMGESRSYKREASDRLAIGAENAAPSIVDGVREKQGASQSAVR